uniref:Uncharacterized protein n=1 Tax=Timema cristinae TaxID=61476 RepID=A0A7R9H223_TIMCR|nr:unnamed protein product [Timema cristinae]
MHLVVWHTLVGAVRTLMSVASYLVVRLCSVVLFFSPTRSPRCRDGETGSLNMQSFNESQEVGLRWPPRGFYSEALTLKFGFNEAVKVQEPPKKVSLIWQLRTEKFAPIIPRLIPPLQRKFLAPEQIVVSFDLEDRKIEFPVQAYHPKVQVEYQVSPGCLPRRVQVERKRREFLAQDITKLLTELGVDPCTLIPPDDDNLDKYNLATSQHFLPLQIFDNQEFDCSEEVMELSKMSCLSLDDSTEEEELLLLAAVMEDEENIGVGSLTC